MKKHHADIICLPLLLLFLLPSLGYSREQGEVLKRDWQLNEIHRNPSGFLEREAGDPYIIFPELEETDYQISGVQMEIAFSPMIAKPYRMELFWRPEHDGFSEQRKVFFILLPPKNGETIKFFLPLKSQDGYKQFRLDFPGDLPSLFQVKSFQPVVKGDIAKDVKRVEAFYSIGATEVRTPSIFIPYLVHTFRHGLGRLLQDPPFLIVWLGLIFAALFTTRAVSRSIRKEELERKENETGENSDFGN